MIAPLLPFLLACTTTLSPAIDKSAAPPPFVKPNPLSGVVLIILENGDPKEAAAMKFVKDKRVTQPVMLRRYFAVAHPSRPNYVALVSASTEGICGDKEPKPPLDRRHLGDLLEAAGQSWAVYAQSLPGKCNPVDNAGGLPRLPRYSRRHLGFFDFADVQKTLCATHIVPEDESLDALNSDIHDGRVPAFAMIIPDNFHNGHNTGIGAADHWLTEKFAPLLDDPRFTRDRVFILTFDENEKHGTEENKVFIMIWGDPVQPTSDRAVLDIPYDHYDLLRTIEELLGAGNLGAHDSDQSHARPIGGIWK